VAHAELRAPLEERVGRADLTRFDLGRTYERHLRIYRGLEGPLTVALVSFFFAHDENCTGLAAYYATLFEALLESGQDVHLITTRDGPSPQAADRVVRVPLSRRHLVAAGSATGSGSLTRLAARLLFSLLAYRRLRTLQRRRGLDAVDAPELFAPGLWAALAMGRKVMTRVHTPSYVGDAYNERYRWRWIGKLVSLPERVQTRRSGAVSVASSGLARLVARDWRLPPERIHVIPNPVSLDWIRRAGQSREKVIPGGYLLYFGRLERRKGVHVISRALPRILRSGPDLKMVFIGRDCGWKATISSENADLADRLLWYDTMPRPELFGAIRHATLVLLPSLFDNLSNALLETMALGRPVVATYGTGAEEIIQDGINGFLVEPGDANALAARTVACLQGADLAAVGRNAFTSIERLDARAIVPRYLELFREMRSAR
jgi:glycosyltransferase involved in cell wall biosynthesis